ncbi:MAG: hypothetical protein PHT38_01075 [Halothiobacillus sp.]|nr:hypothetical protein [Halothiobacillus sp.]
MSGDEVRQKEKFEQFDHGRAEPMIESNQGRSMRKTHIHLPDKTLAGVITLSSQEESVLTGLRLNHRELMATAYIAIKIVMERDANTSLDPILEARNLFFRLRSIPVQLLDEGRANANFLLQIGALTQIGLLAVRAKQTKRKHERSAEFVFQLSNLDSSASSFNDARTNKTKSGFIV